MDFKNKIISSFSHELRTPLNACLVLLEKSLTLREIPEPIKDQTLRIAYLSAKNLLGVVNDILDYSKLLADEFKLNITRENLHQTIQNSLEVSLPKMKEKSLEFKIDCP